MLQYPLNSHLYYPMKQSVFITTLLLLLHFCALAQRKTEYGVQFGGGLAIQHINNSEIISNRTIRTFNINAVVNLPVLKNYYLSARPGITNKGTEITEDALTTTNHITYYNLPVFIIRKYELPTFGKIIGGIGGYAAMGFKGNIMFETPGSDNSNPVNFGNNNDFQRYDAGVSALAGLELNNRLTFTAGYDFGLYNIASSTLKDTGDNSYNRSFSISLGVLF